MNYIEYMEDGNKIINPQYIPGFIQIQPFKRYLIKPNESATVPQGMYRRNFKFNSNEPVSSKGADARHIEVPTIKSESDTNNLFNWLNFPSNQLSYNNLNLDYSSPAYRMSYIASAQ